MSKPAIIAMLGAVFTACNRPCDNASIVDYYVLETRYHECLELLGEPDRDYPGVESYTGQCSDCFLHSADYTEDNCIDFIGCVDEQCIVPGSIDGMDPHDC